MGAWVAIAFVVVAGVKLKILKANHNIREFYRRAVRVVVAGVKLKILKANHNCLLMLPLMDDVVVAGVKLKILKANHNLFVLVRGVMVLLLLV